MEVVTHNATSLAWMGDALMTLRVREHLLNQGYQKPDILQKKSARICSAKAQARILEALKEEAFFHGKGAANSSKRPKRHNSFKSQECRWQDLFRSDSFGSPFRLFVSLWPC